MNSRYKTFYIPYRAEKKDVPQIVDKYKIAEAHYAFSISIFSAFLLAMGKYTNKAAPISYAFITINLIFFLLVGIQILRTKKDYIHSILEKISQCPDTEEIQLHGLVGTDLSLFIQVYLFLYTILCLLSIYNGY